MTFTRKMTVLWIALSICVLLPIANAQTLMPTPALSESAPLDEETIVPTFETQNWHARTCSTSPGRVDRLRTAMARRWRKTDSAIT